MLQPNASFQRNLWLYYAFTFLRNFSLFSGVLVPFFTQWGGITLAQTLLVQSWFMFWMFVLEIPTGAIADYFGRKYSLSLGAFIIALATLVYGSLPNLYIFLLAEFFFAMGAALTSGADEALLYDTLKLHHREAQSTKIFGRAQSISLFSMLVSAPLGSLLASLFGLNAPMLFSSLPLFIASLIGLILVEPKIKKIESESKRYLQTVKDGFLLLWENHTLKVFSIDAIILHSVAYYVVWLYQPLLQSMGVPIALYGWFHVLLLLSEMIVAANYSKLELFTGSSTRLIRITAIITGLAFMLTAIIPHPIIIILFIILAGGIGLTRTTYITSKVNAYIPSHRRATVLSSISMFRRGSNSLANPLVGHVADFSRPFALFGLGLIATTLGLFSPIKHSSSRK